MTISGLLVFAAYTIQAKTGYSEPLTTAKAYTSLALISMLSQPASMLLQTISAVFSVSGNVKRLEGYLGKADIQEPRQLTTNASEKSDSSTYMITIDCIRLDVSNGSKKIFIDLRIMKCTTTMISGPVGSGKSTLMLMLLSEKTSSSGSMSNRAASVGFCSANPWLRNTTIQKNIVNDKKWDHEWYRHCHLYLRSGDRLGFASARK